MLNRSKLFGILIGISVLIVIFAGYIFFGLNSELSEKDVWGRGVNSVGFSDETPNYGTGYCEVVSYNSTSAILRTYVYHDGGPYIWSYKPAMPSNVSFEYSVLGKDLPPSAPQNLTIAWYNDHPKLTWDTNGEPDMQTYKIWKYAAGSSMIAATVTHNASNTTHSWIDNSVSKPEPWESQIEYSYKVKAIDNSNNESLYSNQVSILGSGGIWKKNGEEENNIDITTYELNSNYPNPFNPTTQISYQIPENSFVNLVVYNSLGQEVTTLVNQTQSVGKYTVQFNASNLSSGVYIYKLQAGEFSSTKKMLLMK